MANQELSLFEEPHDIELAAIEPPTTPEVALTSFLSGLESFVGYERKRPTQCVTYKMPFPLYLEFKKAVQECQRLAPEEQKELYTMTSCVVALTQTIALTALKQRAAELRTLRDHESISVA